MSNKNYPLYQVQPFKDFKDMLDQACHANPPRPAFRFAENKAIRDVSYGEFRETVNALGTGIASLGLSGKHIAMVGENCYDWICTYLTVLGSDNVYVPVDKELPFNEIINVLCNSDSEAVFFTRQFEKAFRDNKASLPNIKHFICYSPKLMDDDTDFLDARDLIAKGKALLAGGDTSYISQEPKDDEMGMLVYTSGTTGAAKGVMLTRHNLVSSVYYGMQVSGVYTTSLSVLPYNHTYEAVCDILVSLHNHNTICINENLKTVADNLKKYKPDYIMLVPLFVENFYKRIWKTLEKSGKDKLVRRMITVSNGLRKLGIDKRKKFFGQILDVFGGNVIKIVCGGAPIRPELAEFFDAIGINLINGYGITECSPLVSANRDFYNNFRSVGVVLPCCDIEIKEPNEDGEGEIMVKGDIVMKGYYKNPKATAEVLSDDGWFATGDYGKLEGDLLFITGRKKNLIVLKNGKNVYPEEIEDYIMAVDNVEEVIVYSIKDNHGDESGLCAEIYPAKDFSDGKTVDEMTAYFTDRMNELNRRLPVYKHIYTIKIRETEFDKTTSRKIKRQGVGQ